MKSLSENIPVMNTKKKNAFTLVEVTAALVILALISGSVLVVIDRCLSSTADLTSRMQAFEVARENMENLLSQDSVKEKVDYGTSDKYPNIDWETNVGTFSEPLTSEMWVRAVCSAQYTDLQIKQRQQTYQVIANSLGKEITAEPAASESPAPSQASKPTQTNSEKTYFGYTESELRQMSFAEIIKLLQSGSAN